MRKNIRVVLIPSVLVSLSILHYFSSILFSLFQTNPPCDLKFLSCVRMTSLRREMKNVRTCMFTGATAHYTMLSVFFFYVRYFVDILYFYFKYRTNTGLCNFKLLLAKYVVNIRYCRIQFFKIVKFNLSNAENFNNRFNMINVVK